MKIFWIALLIIFPLSNAIGACGSPVGNNGAIRWDTTESSIKWCNGTSWVNPVIAPGLSCAGNPAGKIAYDSVKMQFCDGTFWQSMQGNQLDFCLGDIPGVFRWDHGRRLMKFCDGVNWYAMFQSYAPVVNSLSINGGAVSTRLNNLSLHLSGSSSETASYVTHFCFKHNSTGTAPSAPDKDDSCWVPVNFPSPGIEPGNAITFSNFFYSIGFTPGTFSVFGWVKTGADTISSLSNSGNGTSGIDVATIDYSPGSPPTLLNVFATNSDSSLIPPGPTDLAIPVGNNVFIKWKLIDDEALPGTPVELSYTTDEVNFTVIATGISNSANPGCSVDGATSTGCYLWSGGSPTNSYFKIRVRALDATGLSAIASAEPNNMSNFKILAGATDPGLGGSAASAIIYSFNKFASQDTGAGNFVVRDNGTFYINDDRGLMTIDPNDGKYKIFLPYTGTATDGALASATLRARPIKIALDYNDRLLIFDHDRIRRVDFNTQTITTIIGGGSSTASGTLASDFEIIAPADRPAALLFTVLPNGNIWFQSRPDTYLVTRGAGGGKIRIYQASDDKVYEWSPSGVGSLEDAGFDPDPYAVYNLGISFNPLTSEITRIRSRSIIPVPGGHAPRSVSYDPTTGQTTTPHVPFVSYWGDDNTIVSRNGEMYSAERFSNPGFYKYNSSTNIWDRIIGTGVKGQCNDGTPATSCPVDITDAFITSQNQIFFIDRGLIRTLDDSGNVITIFGQSLRYGDGELAVNARMSYTPFVDLSSAGKIVFVDASEHVIREFTPDGTIELLAGNGTDSTPDTTGFAKDQPLTAGYWGGPYPLATDVTDGTIYFTRGGTVLSKLDRSTGKWVDIAGGGATTYASADGLLGNQILFDGYNHGPLGFNGTYLLRHSQRWNGTFHPDGLIKAYDKTTGTQSSFAGIAGVEVGTSIDNCTDGTALTACLVPSNFNHALTRARWDATNSRWLILQNGSTKIRTAVQGGNWGTLVTLPRGVDNFEYVMKASVPYVYYCSGGRIYKYNISTSSETALSWPSTSMNCYGPSLVWHPARQSIIFPITQNGLGAIAEIRDP